MKSVGGLSGLGNVLPPNGIGQDNFVRRIADKLIMDFHETGGKTIRNLVSKGDSGSFGDNATWQRKNLVFDGKDDFINYSHDTDLDISDELTLVIFANPADRSGAPQILLSKANYEMREYDDEYIWQALGIDVDWTKSGDVGDLSTGLCVYDGKLYVACWASDEIYVFDGSTWIKSGDVGDGPDGLCVYDGKLYVSCDNSNDIYVFDGSSWVKSGDVGDLPYGLCVYDGKLYVACYTSHDIYVFDGSTWIKSGDVGDWPWGLCVYDGKLYVACGGSDDVYVFDGSTWIKSGDVGDWPWGLCVYDGKLYVSCANSNDVYVFGSGRAIRRDKPLGSALIAGYYKSNEIGISRNGGAFSTASHTLALSSPLLDLHIGKGYGSSQSGLFGGNDEQLKGSISFVRINASVLSPIQILQDYFYTKWRN